MPLPKGDDKRTIATNIKIAKQNMNMPNKQAIALALKQAGIQKKTNGS